MTKTQTVELPDHSFGEARAIWSFNAGTPGTLSDQRGWELDEFWVVGRPTLDLASRRHVEEQLEPPQG